MTKKRHEINHIKIDKKDEREAHRLIYGEEDPFSWQEEKKNSLWIWVIAIILVFGIIVGLAAIIIVRPNISLPNIQIPAIQLPVIQLPKIPSVDLNTFPWIPIALGLIVVTIALMIGLISNKAIIVVVIFIVILVIGIFLVANAEAIWKWLENLFWQCCLTFIFFAILLGIFAKDDSGDSIIIIIIIAIFGDDK